MQAPGALGVQAAALQVANLDTRGKVDVRPRKGRTNVCIYICIQPRRKMTGMAACTSSSLGFRLGCILQAQSYMMRMMINFSVRVSRI